MKKIIAMSLMLLLWCSFLAIGGKATFGSTLPGGSISLWHDRMDFSQMEKLTMSVPYPEPENGQIRDLGGPGSTKGEFSGLSITSTVIIGLISLLTLFFVGKWAYLSIMLTDYEKFQYQMREYYDKHWKFSGAWPEGYHFPYDDIRALDHLFNFKVWTVAHAIHPFDWIDYSKWLENENWRPSFLGDTGRHAIVAKSKMEHYHETVNEGA